MNFHYNSETGKVARCKANSGNCPLNGGETPHFDSKKDAENYSAKVESEQNNLFPEVKIVKRERPNNHPMFQSLEECENFSNPIEFFENRYKAHEEHMKARGFYGANNSMGEGHWRKWQRENPGLALTKDPEAPKKVTIYRSGKMQPSTYNGITSLYADEADYFRPEGAAPRHGSLFAGADAKSFKRWFNSNKYRQDLAEGEPHAIVVDPNEVRVYHIPSWEEYSWHGAHPTTYWESGILLSRFNKAAAENNWDTSEWEILVPPQAVKSSRPMGTAAVLKVLEGELDEAEIDSVKFAMKNIITWRKFKKNSF